MKPTIKEILSPFDKNANKEDIKDFTGISLDQVQSEPENNLLIIILEYVFFFNGKKYSYKCLAQNTNLALIPLLHEFYDLCISGKSNLEAYKKLNSLFCTYYENIKKFYGDFLISIEKTKSRINYDLCGCLISFLSYLNGNKEFIDILDKFTKNETIENLSSSYDKIRSNDLWCVVTDYCIINNIPIVYNYDDKKEKTKKRFASELNEIKYYADVCPVDKSYKEFVDLLYICLKDCEDIRTNRQEDVKKFINTIFFIFNLYLSKFDDYSLDMIYEEIYKNALDHSSENTDKNYIDFIVRYILKYDLPRNSFLFLFLQGLIPGLFKQTFNHLNLDENIVDVNNSETIGTLLNIVMEKISKKKRKKKNKKNKNKNSIEDDNKIDSKSEQISKEAINLNINNKNESQIPKPQEKNNPNENSIPKLEEKNNPNENSIPKTQEKNNPNENSIPEPQEKNITDENSIPKPQEQNISDENSIPKPQEKNNTNENSNCKENVNVKETKNNSLNNEDERSKLEQKEKLNNEESVNIQEEFKLMKIEMLKYGEKIEKVEKKISDLIAENSGLKREISGLKEKISDLNGQYLGLNEKISDLNEQNSDLKGEISGLNGKISNLESSQTKIDKEFEKLKVEVNLLKKQIDIISFRDLTKKVLDSIINFVSKKNEQFLLGIAKRKAKLEKINNEYSFEGCKYMKDPIKDICDKYYKSNFTAHIPDIINILKGLPIGLKNDYPEEIAKKFYNIMINSRKEKQKVLNFLIEELNIKDKINEIYFPNKAQK